MIVTSARTNIVEVTYVERDHSESQVVRHPITNWSADTDWTYIVDDIRYEYEDRKGGEVIAIYFTDRDGRRRSWYLANGIDY